MATDASEDWERWHERRVATVSAPYGPLALIGTLPQCLNGLGAPPGSRTVRTVDFRTSPGPGGPTATRWC